MPGILERIKDIETEMARTQKNKATNHHLGLLRAKLSQLRATLLEPAKGAGGKREGFEVKKSGNASIALIGFPSVGKSSFLNEVCTVGKNSNNNENLSAVAAVEFTTLTCIPGLLQYNDTRIQLLDLPGIIEGASKGKGRGRQVIAVGRSVDLILMMVDAVKGDIQKRLLTKELHDCGIRLNCKARDVYVKSKKGGGIRYNATVPMTHLNERLVRGILQSYKMHNTDIVCREDCTTDEFIDIIEGNRKYIPCVYVYNKIDNMTIEELDMIARDPHNVVCSVKQRLNLDFVLEKCWDALAMIRIYCKPQGSAPDLSEPFVLTNGCTIAHLCKQIHRDMIDKFKYALVYGKSAKHRPQQLGLGHELMDGDVVQIMTIEG